MGLRGEANDSADWAASLFHPLHLLVGRFNRGAGNRRSGGAPARTRPQRGQPFHPVPGHLRGGARLRLLQPDRQQVRLGGHRVAPVQRHAERGAIRHRQPLQQPPGILRRRDAAQPRQPRSAPGRGGHLRLRQPGRGRRGRPAAPPGQHGHQSRQFQAHQRRALPAGVHAEPRHVGGGHRSGFTQDGLGDQHARLRADLSNRSAQLLHALRRRENALDHAG